MLTLLLSLLGGGGALGLALRFIPGAADKGRKALGWATSNTSHLLLIALVAVGVHDWLGHRSAAKWQRNYDKTVTVWEAEKKAHTITRASVSKLTGELDAQSKAVRLMQKDAEERQKRAQGALAATKARGARLEAKARTLEADAASLPPSGKNCKTPKALTDLRDDL